MKKLRMLLMFVLTLVIASSCGNAQKLTADQKRANKMIKKEVKQMKKAGWEVAPGNLSMELQLKEFYTKALERDTNGYDKFISGEAMSMGENYDAAMFQASNLAKLDLAGKIQTEVTELIDNKLANKQISKQDAVSLAESVATSKNLVAQKIGRVISPVKMYRDLENGKVEVRTVIYYSHELAMEAVRQTLREDLESKADELSKQLDNLLKL